MYKNKPEFHKMKPLILKEQKGKCARCHCKLMDKKGKVLTKANCHHIDHSGGTDYENNSKENLLYLCRECHTTIHILNPYSKPIGTHLENLFMEAECKLIWHQIRGINPESITLNTRGDYCYNIILKSGK